MTSPQTDVIERLRVVSERNGLMYGDTEAVEDAITEIVRLRALTAAAQAREKAPANWDNEIIVADMIDKLMDNIGTDRMGISEEKIRDLLWDNKMGFVRLAQSMRAAAGPSLMTIYSTTEDQGPDVLGERKGEE